VDTDLYEKISRHLSTTYDDRSMDRFISEIVAEVVPLAETAEQTKAARRVAYARARNGAQAPQHASVKLASPAPRT
jgi:hypothetical protein